MMTKETEERFRLFFVKHSAFSFGRCRLHPMGQNGIIIWCNLKEDKVLTAREYIKHNFNVPNILTIIRLLLVPVYVALFAAGEKYSALTVFLLASFTDLLDGRIARKYNLITDFGKLMDPLADKIMVLTAMFSMAIGNRRIQPVIPWLAVIILLAKEIYMVWGAARLYKKGIVAYSSMIGKVAQCAFIVGLVSVFFHDWFAVICDGWFMTLDVMLIWLAVILTLCAVVRYNNHYRREAREKGFL